jgi:hypothetical protein
LMPRFLARAHPLAKAATLQRVVRSRAGDPDEEPAAADGPLMLRRWRNG